MKNINLVILFIFCLCSNLMVAQENEHEEDNHQNNSEDSHKYHDEFKRHSLFIELGFTHIPDAYENISGDQDIWVPTIGLAYSYGFSHKWGAILAVNYEAESYFLNFNHEDLKRDNVLILVVLAKYEVMNNWAVFAGPGIELEEHHNFAVFRFGTEYVVPLPKNWFLAPVLTFDYKQEFTSLEFALGIGKRF